MILFDFQNKKLDIQDELLSRIELGIDLQIVAIPIVELSDNELKCVFEVII
jgi:hypothetical protein